MGSRSTVSSYLTANLAIAMILAIMINCTRAIHTMVFTAAARVVNIIESVDSISRDTRICHNIINYYVIHYKYPNTSK